MPRYYFNVRCDGIERDEDGIDLPDLEAAKLAASHLAALVLKETPGAIWQGESRSVEITDTSGMVLGAIHLMATVSRTPAAETNVDKFTFGHEVRQGDSAPRLLYRNENDRALNIIPILDKDPKQ